jgi:hypothetical protein
MAANRAVSFKGHKNWSWKKLLGVTDAGRHSKQPHMFFVNVRHC